MKNSAWRTRAAQVIERTLKQNPGLSVQETRKALRQAYPFGERRMWPYKCWLIEVRLALLATARLRGETPPRLGKIPQPRRRSGTPADIPGQLLLGGGTGR